MENLIKLLGLLNNNSNNSEQQKKPEQPKIPKEVLDQYPYGEFPTRYTKLGQENIRKNSETRYANDTHESLETTPRQNNNIDISSLLPFLQLMNNKNKSTDTMKILSDLLFKDNKDLKQLFNFISKNNSQEIKDKNPFPDTNKINISSLKKVN